MRTFNFTYVEGCINGYWVTDRLKVSCQPRFLQWKWEQAMGQKNFLRAQKAIHSVPSLSSLYLENTEEKHHVNSFSTSEQASKDTRKSNFKARLKRELLILIVFKTIKPEWCYAYISELVYSTINNYLPNSLNTTKVSYSW